MTTLAEVEDTITARWESGIIRPMWSVGLTDQELFAIARQERLNPFATDWGDSIDSTVLTEARQGVFKNPNVPTMRDLQHERAVLKSETPTKRAKTGRGKRNKRPAHATTRIARDGASSKMTEFEATNFDRISIANALHVETSLKCECQAYIDVFTFRRWIAQGYCVRKGEKAIRTPIVKDVITETDDGEVKDRRVMGASAVFCRCQVDPLKVVA